MQNRTRSSLLKHKILILFFTCFTVFSQEIVPVSDITIPTDFSNIYVHPIAGDSLSSSFLIVVSDTVLLHKHLFHSEHIYVVDGTAIMYLNNTKQAIKANDVLFIPKGTWHAVKVTSSNPLQVISIQSPAFDGTDRVWPE